MPAAGARHRGRRRRGRAAPWCGRRCRRRRRRRRAARAGGPAGRGHGHRRHGRGRQPAAGARGARGRQGRRHREQGDPRRRRAPRDAARQGPRGRASRRRPARPTPSPAPSAGCARSTRSIRRSGSASSARTSLTVDRLIITASGGPFLDTPAAEFAAITPQQALRHPTWSMGAKITINSATLANKGLEVIEARWLYDVGYEQIDVVIHPQSVVHSAVQFVDGSLKAQLGNPDMRLPIQYALTYPVRRPSPAAAPDLVALARLDFRAPDETQVSRPPHRPRRRSHRPARHGRAHRRRRRGGRALPRRLPGLPGHPAPPGGRGGEIRHGAWQRRARRRRADRPRRRGSGRVRGPVPGPGAVAGATEARA